jgi:hypothetical protein
MRKIPFLFILTILVSNSLCRDLVRTDIASVFVVQDSGVTDTFGIWNADTLMYYANFSDYDSTSWPIADTLFSIIEIYKVELGSVNWRTISFIEYMARFHLTSTDGRSILLATILRKANQNSDQVDLAEAERDLSEWPVRNLDQIRFGVVLGEGWSEKVNPFYRNSGLVTDFVNNIPADSAQFEYLAVHYRITSLQAANDIIRIDPDYYPNCRWSVWFPDDVYWPYPIDPDSAIEVVMPDSGTFGEYSIGLDTLDLPDGTYEAFVNTARHELVKELEGFTLGSRGVYEFALDFEDRTAQPDYVEFVTGDFFKRVILLPRPFGRCY